jgi:hypothetical protein
MLAAGCEVLVNVQVKLEQLFVKLAVSVDDGGGGGLDVPKCV